MRTVTEQKRETTLRETWDFTYRTTEVLEAARRKVQHHKARGAWWTEELERAEKSLKEKGFEYRHHEHSYREDLVIVGDPSLAARAKECRDKIDDHREKQTAYESWVRALDGKAKSLPDSALTLRIEDVVFFSL